VPGISLGGCNDKVIGVYDDYGLTSGIAGWAYSVEDTLGHGSHTASTAAGNERPASLGGYAPTISGLAPHANLVVFRVCIPNTSCSSLAIVAAIDQAVADGVVDVLNFSITGTTGPWLDPVAKAFLAAADAGIFVSAAAGNTDGVQLQVPGSVMNSAPWIATVGAGTHPGGAIVQGVRAPMQADELAAFSLLGPTRYGYEYLKPDLQAPGVHILAATRNDGSADGARHVAMMEGTSMATAHTSGSGALLLGLHPDWTPLEAKSALMMTARESGLTKADGVTPSDFFDRGSGRVDEFLAGRAGLVMDETGARFAAANPDGGGDPTTLNLPSMQNSRCSGACTFNRVFRSTQNHAVTWTARVVAAPGSAITTVSVTPASMTVPALALSPSVAVRADTSKVAADGKIRFAEIVLAPNDTQLTPLHLAVAVAVPAP
jgi:subtilisin family serine protease